MKQTKRLLCLLFVGTLLFAAACSGSNGDKEKGNADAQEAQGRYVESDITPPIEGRFQSFLREDGTLVCLDEGMKTRYESSDGGKSWNESAGPGSGTDRYQNAQMGTMLPDGRVLVYLIGEGLVMVSPDGSGTPYPIAEIDEAAANGDNVSVSLLQALGGERLLLSYMAGGMVMQTTRQGGGPIGGSAQVNGAAPVGGGVRVNPEDGDGAEASETRRNVGVEEDAEPKETQQAVLIEEDAEDPARGADMVEGDATESDVPQPGAQDAPRGPAGSTAFSGRAMEIKTILLDIETGQKIADLPVESAVAATCDDAEFYVMGNGGSISAYNLIDGMPSGKEDIGLGSGQQAGGRMGFGMRMGAAGGSVLTLNPQGTLYAALEGSLLSADWDGNVHTALESSSYSLGSPRAEITAVFAPQDGSIIVNLLSNSRDNRLYRYVWDENASFDPEKTITIWSLEENSFVRAAMAELRKKHPDASMRYEVALDADSAMSAADAIKTLNTRLLSGNGPDVVVLDGCPVDSYVDKGMLLDLSGLVATDDIFENLLAPYWEGEELYCVPTQFLFPALMGSAEELTRAGTLEELVSLIVKGNDLPARGAPGSDPFSGIPVEDRAALYFTDLQELCEILWLSCAPDVIADNKLNTDALRTYLETAKAISDKYALTETSQGPGMRAAFSDGGSVTVMSGSLMRYTAQMTNYGAFSVGNLQMMQMMMERVGSELIPFPGMTQGAWKPSAVVGISADTKVESFAAELVKAMLSPEVQQLNYGTGLTVTHTGLELQIQTINDWLAEDDRGVFDVDIDGLIGLLETPSMEDTALTDMMWNSVERCCKGETDVEGAVKEIEQTIKNYLAERS